MFWKENSQKGIIIGKGGQKLKQIGEAARKNQGFPDKVDSLYINADLATMSGDHPYGNGP